MRVGETGYGRGGSQEIQVAPQAQLDPMGALGHILHLKLRPLWGAELCTPTSVLG